MTRDNENEVPRRPDRLPPAASAAATPGSASVRSLPASGAAPPPRLVTADSGPLMIELTRVLEVLIEGYLLGDLESMATEVKPKQIGGVGYPIVMAVLAGSELLGALTSDGSAGNRIQHYLHTHMAKVNEKYGDLGEIADDLFRNGIAHSYLSRPGVLVVRGDSDWHLQLTRDGLIFECVALYRDFRRSYEEYAKQHILDHQADAQRRLNKLTEHDHLKVGLIERLPPERWSLTDVDVRSTFVGVMHATPLLLRSLT